MDRGENGWILFNQIHFRIRFGLDSDRNPCIQLDSDTDFEYTLTILWKSDMVMNLKAFSNLDLDTDIKVYDSIDF